MKDSKLLECAAANAGYNKFEGHAQQMIDGGWNPLFNDGDAFRLAINMSIEFLHESYQSDDGELGVCAYGLSGHSVFVSYVSCQGDRHEATRRAIVMAAAEDY